MVNDTHSEMSRRHLGNAALARADIAFLLWRIEGFRPLPMYTIKRTSTYPVRVINVIPPRAVRKTHITDAQHDSPHVQNTTRSGRPASGWLNKQECAHKKPAALFVVVHTSSRSTAAVVEKKKSGAPSSVSGELSPRNTTGMDQV